MHKTPNPSTTCPKHSIGTSAVPRPARIALVGHCGSDSRMLRRVVERVFPVADVAMVNDAVAAKAHAKRADLLLVNRTLEGDFDTGFGLDLIRELLRLPEHRAALMLISDLGEAQTQAKAVGAVPGFGKSNADSLDAAQRMCAAVEGVLAGQ